MSAIAMYGRDVRYRRRLEVLGRLLADMGYWTPIYCRGPIRAESRQPRSPKIVRSTKSTFAGRSARRRMK